MNHKKMKKMIVESLIRDHVNKDLKRKKIISENKKMQRMLVEQILQEIAINQSTQAYANSLRKLSQYNLKPEQIQWLKRFDNERRKYGIDKYANQIADSLKSGKDPTTGKPLSADQISQYRQWTRNYNNNIKTNGSWDAFKKSNGTDWTEDDYKEYTYNDKLADIQKKYGAGVRYNKADHYANYGVDATVDQRVKDHNSDFLSTLGGNKIDSTTGKKTADTDSDWIYVRDLRDGKIYKQKNPNKKTTPNPKQSTNQGTNQSTNQSTTQGTNQSTNQSTNPNPKQSTTPDPAESTDAQPIMGDDGNFVSTHYKDKKGNIKIMDKRTMDALSKQYPDEAKWLNRPESVKIMSKFLAVKGIDINNPQSVQNAANRYNIKIGAGLTTVGIAYILFKFLGGIFPWSK